MPKPTNINELRLDLLEAYDMLRQDPRRVIQVGELANTAGKIINSVKVELEYAMLRKEKPSLPFLDYHKPPTLDNATPAKLEGKK